ncbi:hypothetical protein Pla86_05320 [Planctomycetes bacterium Pla86]|uniref:Uncharacterized protein n=1 Tax=Engelhardtia mirabilis TaxID=2528011 RepID=A0A518BEQ4_9BACT|nr:hypothetical protein Pla133_05320 [Planctomycetes bacterium Pla133]QDU99793.1 hypothetical protein Pla86_05320 [Planctomycetes bacterium Pla86]
MTEDVPSSAADRYHRLESQRLRAQALGTISEGQLDAWLEKLDELWHYMNSEERVEANRRASQVVNSSHESDLGLRDVPVEVGGSRLPRTAA